MTRNRRTSSSLPGLGGIVVALAALTASLAASSPAGAKPPDGPDGPEPPRPGFEFELPGADDPPLPPGLRIRRPGLGDDDGYDVLARSFDVTITGNSEHSLGTRLERRSDDGPWVGVTIRSRLVGDFVHHDDGLEPDTRYCYRSVAYNFAGETRSPVQCVVTRAEEPQPVARIRLEVRTADIAGAGTRDGRTAATLALGNSTWLDLPGADFGRGVTRMYDLIPTGIADLTDIEHLRISGGADDPWCLDDVKLRINYESFVVNDVVFHEDFADQPDGCRWFDRAAQSTVLKIPHRSLRDDPEWVYPPLPLPALGVDPDGNDTAEIRLAAGELTSRLQSLIGHGLHGQDARWRADGVTLSGSTFRNDYVHVKARLEGSKTLTPFGGTVWVDVDVDFDLFFVLSQTEVGGDIRLTVDPRNVDASFSPWVTWAGRVFDVLPCGPVASTVTGDAIPGCFAAIEGAVQRGIQRGLAGVGVNTTIPGSLRCCSYFEIDVDQNGGVKLILGLVSDDGDGPAAEFDGPAQDFDRPATVGPTDDTKISPQPPPRVSPRAATPTRPRRATLSDTTSTKTVPAPTNRFGPNSPSLVW